MTVPSEQVLFGWGKANHARSLVYRPKGREEVADALADVRRRGLTLTHRGAGQSYGDAALNQGGAVLETTGLDRVLDYDPREGTVRAEAGVTIDRLWRGVLSDGWWPPVVPGTSRPTLGGCLAMNVHGKNHLTAGSFGDHVTSVTAMRPDGEITEHERGEDGFASAVGAQGTTGTILALELEMTRVTSGFLGVEARTAGSLDESMAILGELAEAHDHAVAWVDCFASGRSLGHAELHGASRLDPDHPRAGDGLTVEEQLPPKHVLGLVPRRRLVPLLRCAVNDPGMKALNRAKFLHARTVHPSAYLEPHASFHFLLDYVPGWERAYGEGGLVQYQFFVSAAEAEDVFREALRLQHKRRTVSYLGVLKRHRRDPFPQGCSVDGYSLALDFPVRRGRLLSLMELLADFDQLQEQAGGQVYAAKDAVSRLGRAPEGADDGLFSSNLLRRWRG